MKDKQPELILTCLSIDCPERKSLCCRGKLKTSNGYIWSYREQNKKIDKLIEEL